MNTLNIKKAVLVLWLALTLSFSTGIFATQIGLDGVNVTHASGMCGGGGC
ncbi:MAG: hypothetical protein AB8G95_20650 [Anaerolineae bacterium]